MKIDLKIYKRVVNGLATLLFAFNFENPTFAQKPSSQVRDIVINGEVKATITFENEEKANKSFIAPGRVSGHLTFSQQSLQDGDVYVEAINIALFGVDQAAIVQPLKENDSYSTLGLVAHTPSTFHGKRGTDSSARNLKLKYDKSSGLVSGTLRGQMSIDYFAELTERNENEGHALHMETLPVLFEVAFPLAQELAILDGDQKLFQQPGENGHRILVDPENAEPSTIFTTKLSCIETACPEDFEVKPLNRGEGNMAGRKASQAKTSFERLKIKGGTSIDIKPVSLRTEVDWLGKMEPAKSLCIQPVRVGRYSFNWKNKIFGIPIPKFEIKFSGEGLAFGMPGVLEQWGKANTSFVLEDWITVWDESFSELSLNERKDLLQTVNIPDCIEVFFVDSFFPSYIDGGGFITSYGTATGKIVTSDQNADYKIDLTHLAHEFGHALNLAHPEEGPERGIPGSKGTLMCESGFKEDNPRLNSEENAINSSNPLIQYSLTEKSTKFDCTDIEGCGSCN